MPAPNLYVLNRRAFDGLKSICDEYSIGLVAQAMHISKSTFLRVMKGNPFYMRTGLKIAEALSKDKEDGIPLHVIFHEVKEDMQS